MKAMHTPATHSAPFDTLASSYDDGYDTSCGRRIFAGEVAGLRDLLEEAPRPWLEVGVGTGRFGEALRIDEGVDPNDAMRRLAAGRGLAVCAGRAEALPYASERFGVVMLIMTLCFLSDPAAAFRECRRILRRDGRLIVGIVPRESPMGRRYAQKSTAGHPIYSQATFYTPRDVRRLADRADLVFDRAVSCLLTPASAPRDGIVPEAGFVALSFHPLVAAPEQSAACEAVRPVRPTSSHPQIGWIESCTYVPRQGWSPC